MGIIYNSPADFSIPYDVFVETGTAHGHSVDWVLQHGHVGDIHTIECEKQLFDSASRKYRNNTKVHLHHGFSCDVLPHILRLVPKHSRVIWWLDAHYPESLLNTGYWKQAKNKQKNLPLINELDIIKNSRDCSQDYIVCDDLRIYEKGPYKNGNLPSGIPGSEEILEEHLRSWRSTHHIKRSYKQEGYLYLKPKGNGEVK